MAEIRLKSTGTIKLFENDNTSSVTIASPASLGGDRTITVPDADVTLLTGWSTDSGTNDSLVPASASAGIYLGVAAATAANLLDDYEEGTWTAQDTDGGGSNQFGMYTKIGNLVTCQFSLTTGAISGSDTFYITNLPFTVGSTDAFRGPVTIAYTNATTMILAGNVVESSTTAYLLIATGDIATDDEIGASKVIAAAITYRV